MSFKIMLRSLAAIVLLAVAINAMDITKTIDSVIAKTESKTMGDTIEPANHEVSADEPRLEGAGLGFGVPGVAGHGLGLPGVAGHGFGTDQCPMQTDILDAARLSDDPIGYPILDIAAELGLRPQFAAFLADQVVLPGTDPVIPEDPRFLSANSTCPFIRKQLWSFIKTTGICWVLQGYQPQIFFADCLTKKCAFCSNPFGFNTENQCLKQYEYVSAYVYCPSIAFPKIINERFLIPRYCTCKVVNCAPIVAQHNPFLGLPGFQHLGFGKK